jgi:hypothetical protein
VFCDGKAVVLPSAKEGVAAVVSCRVIEDFIKVWALIWYFVYFWEAQVLLSTKPGINSIIATSLIFVVSGFPTNRYIGFCFRGCPAACQGEGAASIRLLRRSIITHVSCQVNCMAASGCKSMLRNKRRINNSSFTGLLDTHI